MMDTREPVNCGSLTPTRLEERMDCSPKRRRSRGRLRLSSVAFSFSYHFFFSLLPPPPPLLLPLSLLLLNPLPLFVLGLSYSRDGLFSRSSNQRSPFNRCPSYP
ncbi:hypothetical protein BO99DRAFT_16289 [Aspergillus violaceofuscus CBS 115571]|uniref:Transmembrane protein n=1 Tax=Aspergillus violaceofuscus (strain CBS 115571) TaxID=1450538 RepID=A0A2V5GUD7_ASPV1|nr:hypothetical protein BO99DRAFT_16289 [Aspergillus violaceofuscus CBS 115571]